MGITMKILFRRTIGALALMAFLGLESYAHAVNLTSLGDSKNDVFVEENRRRVAAAVWLTCDLPELDKNLQTMLPYCEEYYFLSPPNENPLETVKMLGPLIIKCLTNLETLRKPSHNEIFAEDEEGVPVGYNPDERVEICYSALNAFQNMPKNVLNTKTYASGAREAQKRLRELIKPKKRLNNEGEEDESEAKAAADLLDLQGQETSNSSKNESDEVERLRTFSYFFLPSERREIDLIIAFLNEERPTDLQWEHAKQLVGQSRDGDPNELPDDALYCKLQKYADVLRRKFNSFYELFSENKKDCLKVIKLLVERDEVVSADESASATSRELTIPPELLQCHKKFLEFDQFLNVPHKLSNGQYRVPTEEDIILYGENLRQKIMDTETISQFFEEILVAVSRKVAGKTPKWPEETTNFVSNLNSARKLINVLLIQVRQVIEFSEKQFPQRAIPDNIQKLLNKIRSDEGIIYNLSFENKENLNIELGIRSGRYKDELSRMEEMLEFFKKDLGFNSKETKGVVQPSDDSNDVESLLRLNLEEAQSVVKFFEEKFPQEPIPHNLHYLLKKIQFGCQSVQTFSSHEEQESKMIMQIHSGRYIFKLSRMQEELENFKDTVGFKPEVNVYLADGADEEED